MPNQWRKLAISLAVSSLLGGAVLALALLLDTGESAPPPIIDGTPGPGAHGAGGGPEFIKPERVTDGEWMPVELNDLPTADQGPITARHVGEVINGIRILGIGESGQTVCSGKQQRSDLPVPFEPSYLPPNTFQMAKPEVLLCDDGAVESAHLLYQIGSEGALSAFGINYVNDLEQATATGTGEAMPLTINGFPAVAILGTQEGYPAVGPASVVIDTPNGSVSVVGNNMPLDELLKIAEGLKCAAC